MESTNIVSLRNAFGIYHAIEKILRQTDSPLTCVDLFDSPLVKEFVPDANRVSDYLGHMYRRGLLRRFPAPKDQNSAARYAYTWKDPRKSAPNARNTQPRLRVADPSVTSGGERAVLLSRPNLEITEDGRIVTIELPTLTITVKQK